MAGNKYLFWHWSAAISEYLKQTLDASNCLQVFDQLFRTNDVEVYSTLKSFVSNHSAEAFTSCTFIELSQDALIELLKFEQLHIAEINLLQLLAGWVSAEIQRQDLPLTREHTQKVFEPIKPFVKFTDLTASEVAEFDEIHEMLTSEEVASLLVHLMNQQKPFMIECQTFRLKDGAKPGLDPRLVERERRKRSEINWANIQEFEPIKLIRNSFRTSQQKFVRRKRLRNLGLI